MSKHIKEYEQPSLAQQVRDLKSFNRSLKKQLRKEEKLRASFLKFNQENNQIRVKLRELHENPPKPTYTF